MKSNGFIGLVLLIFIFSIQNNHAQTKHRLVGFNNSPYFDEQVLVFQYDAEIKVTINASSPQTFNPLLPVNIALFALPNGNTTDQTIGKVLDPGDDWHYDIQHIGAQTRFIRNHADTYNLVTVYLENSSMSWPAWKANHNSDHAQIINSLVDSIRNIFGGLETYVTLTGHSGGGRFTFSFLDFGKIPNYVKRISFLDSDYGYEDYYGINIANWLKESNENVLSVIAYNDSVALYNGAPVVSATGGTWYRSKMMQRDLSKQFEFTKEENDEFINYAALEGRIQIRLKKNPERLILHTVQVELNGFIQGMVSATEYENVDYVYYGDRAYTDLIQKNIVAPKQLNIPPRPLGSITGSEFMQSVANLDFDTREERIYKEISRGNIPSFLRTLTKIKSTFQDASGAQHTVEYEVMPDYLAIGSDEDYCRIPMGPLTAQRLGDLFGASMPTKKLVDNIYSNADVKLPPLTYYPIGNQNELVSKFVQHSNAIDHQLDSAGASQGQLVGGIKKDVIISNKIVDPSRTHHVTIYGWHQLNGNAIQPVYNGHINIYVDYSHGIRFINTDILIDGVLVKYQDILKDDIQYKILSDESGPMSQPSYFKISGLPEQPKSFGIINDGPDKLKIIIEPDENVESYNVVVSVNGTYFSQPFSLDPKDLTLANLSEGTLYFIKIEGVNQIGKSGYSEVLAIVPSSETNSTLIVNGFERTSAGNTFDLIRQHGTAFSNNNISFNSATNDAVIDGLFNLSGYNIVEYILGDESTADETFNSLEQLLISDYLRNGGNLFVSGSELAWDLDYKGSSTDKSFIKNFLKCEYIADAPNNTQNTYYSVDPVMSTEFDNLPQFKFDNGTHGTYNVQWPDVINPSAGSTGFLTYTGLSASTGFAGVMYDGLFSEGTIPGKVVTLGFPFETIYPESVRNNFISSLISFFNKTTDVPLANKSSVPESYQLYQNYPNPFNPVTTIEYALPEMNNMPAGRQGVQLTIYNVLGQQVATLVDKIQPSGKYQVRFDANELSSGIYIYKLSTGTFSQIRKMTLVK